MDIGGLCFQLGDILFHLGKAGVAVEGVDIITEADKSLRGNRRIGKALTHSLNAGDIVVQLVKAVQEIPKPELFVGAFCDCTEIPYKFQPVEQLNYFFPQVGESEDIRKDLLTVIGDTGVRGGVGEDIEDEPLFFWIIGYFGAYGIKSQIVDNGLGQLSEPVCTAVGEKNTYT